MMTLFYLMVYATIGLTALAVGFVFFELIQAADRKLRERIQRWLVQRTMRRLATKSVRSFF